MANLRILYDNAADRATSLSASTTSGTLAAANMQSDYKGLVHRSTGTSVTYTLTWTNGEAISGVALPATNLTSSATVQVRLYSDTGCTTLLADSTALSACAGLNLGYWSVTIDANSFAYGVLAKASIWFSQTYTTKGMKIDIVDASNPAGYIDCSRIVAGAYWSPQYNADYGATVTLADTTSVSRNEAGDLLPDLGTVHDEMSLSLSYLSETDRAALVKLFRTVRASENLFVSLLPANTSAVAEQDHMIYGKRSNAPVTLAMANRYGAKIDIIGW